MCVLFVYTEVLSIQVVGMFDYDLSPFNFPHFIPPLLTKIWFLYTWVFVPLITGYHLYVGLTLTSSNGESLSQYDL